MESCSAVSNRDSCPKAFHSPHHRRLRPFPGGIKKHGPITSGGRDLHTPMKGCRHKPQTTGGGDRGHPGSRIRGQFDLGRVKLHYMYTHTNLLKDFYLTYCIMMFYSTKIYSVNASSFIFLSHRALDFFLSSDQLYLYLNEFMSCHGTIK